MSDIGSEHESSMELMIESYLKLQNKDPNHELLSLVNIHDDKQGFSTSEKFWEKFQEPKDKYKCQVYIRYFIALEKAVDTNAFKTEEKSKENIFRNVQPDDEIPF